MIKDVFFKGLIALGLGWLMMVHAYTFDNRIFSILVFISGVSYWVLGLWEHLILNHLGRLEEWK